MNTLIRTFVKTEERLAILERTICSVVEHGLKNLGKIVVMDGNSSFSDRIEELCQFYGVEYFLITDGGRGTKHGLYWSLKLDQGDDLHLVDDCIVGKGIDKICQDTESDIEKLGQIPWLVSYFACYPRDTSRRYWEYPAQNFYAAIACRFHEDLRQKYIRWWEGVMEGFIPDEDYQDDLMLKKFVLEANKKIFNTGKDYAQHTGMGNRAFTDNPTDESSNYQTNYFVGE